MSDRLKVGDVVKLKSGGEKMTIEEIDNEGYVSHVYGFRELSHNELPSQQRCFRSISLEPEASALHAFSDCGSLDGRSRSL